MLALVLTTTTKTTWSGLGRFGRVNVGMWKLGRERVAEGLSRDLVFEEWGGQRESCGVRDGDDTFKYVFVSLEK